MQINDRKTSENFLGKLLKFRKPDEKVLILGPRNETSKRLRRFCEKRGARVMNLRTTSKNPGFGDVFFAHPEVDVLDVSEIDGCFKYTLRLRDPLGGDISDEYPLRKTG